MSQNRRLFLTTAATLLFPALAEARFCTRRRRGPSRHLDPIAGGPCADRGYDAADRFAKAATIADWKKGKFAGCFTTTAKIPAGAEVRVRVVGCPPVGVLENGVLLSNVLGLAFEDVRLWSGISPGQYLTHEMKTDNVLGLSAQRWTYAGPVSITRIDDFHRLVMAHGERRWTLDVKVFLDF